MRFDRIIAMLGAAWAIRTETLDALAEALDAFVSGGSPNIEAFASGAGAEGETRPYALAGDVALIPVVGALVKRNGMFSCFNTYSGVQDMVARALEDSRVGAVLLVIDSPGGTVDGCHELAGFLAAAGRQKPLYAYADGQMTSAAYWLGSCAREIAAPPLAVAGSIGVVCVHFDRSVMDEKAGLKRTYLSAGKFKALGNDATPLSDDARGVLQGFLDSTYTVFLENVAQNRGLDTAQADVWADGKVFMADDALAVGLVDHVMTLEAFVSRIQAQLANGQTSKGVASMDLKELKAEHPHLVRELQAEFAAEFAASAPDTAAVVTAERTRIVALAGAALGQESGGKLAALVDAGVTAEQVAAVSGVLGKALAPAPSTPDAKARMLAAIQAAAPDPVQSAEQAAPVNDIHALAKQLAGAR